MKKIILLLIVFAAVFQLKAQQLFRANPPDNSALLNKYLKSQPGVTFPDTGT
jgi:hypothetical protein